MWVVGYSPGHMRLAGGNAERLPRVDVAPPRVDRRRVDRRVDGLREVSQREGLWREGGQWEGGWREGR